MDIYINGRFLTQKITGVQRYAIELVKALDQVIDQEGLPSHVDKLVILTPPNISTKLPLKHILVQQVGKQTGHLWEQTELPQYTKKKMLINLCNAGPISKKNQISVLHDMAVYAREENFSFLFKNWYKILLRSQGILAKKIITVSNFSKNEIIKYLKINSQKVHVIYEGKEHFTSLASDKEFIVKRGLANKPYILAVSSLNPSKNFKSIVESMQYLTSSKFNIVIAGGIDPKVFSQKGNDLPENVVHVGYVSDEELKALYENAYCFIYPSLYEGFGLPPLEAMSIGCPVIVSNRASLPEVGEQAVLYCDPDNPRTIAEQVLRLEHEPELRSVMIRKGKAQAEKFTWKKCARELLSLV